MSSVDHDMLNSLKELLDEKFSQLIQTYLEDGSRRMELLKEAVADSNFEGIRQEAHGLKGSSRNIGANPIAELCAQLEIMGRDKLGEGIEQQFASVEQEFAAVSSELEKYLN
ncbi:Hpt domain-containing protein [Teredinibacter sp. KSP-S5-2]|uniref:Hpt domain-containing protein n=1 Tax=Teredinibacter sp. KSP-S5-2 TaxID=3034506 RepID=UPI00293511F1|nr:Hpt domain-containing protein [Teredinibacter sp. KSP-S5-2]WNO07907.1 Hpt domain-containing protein [Teredinibacter sp. KSP-S5-2]